VTRDETGTIPDARVQFKPRSLLQPEVAGGDQMASLYMLCCTFMHVSTLGELVIDAGAIFAL
jgi:hypothetical protein